VPRAKEDLKQGVYPQTVARCTMYSYAGELTLDDAVNRRVAVMRDAACHARRPASANALDH